LYIEIQPFKKALRPFPKGIKPISKSHGKKRKTLFYLTE